MNIDWPKKILIDYKFYEKLKFELFIINHSNHWLLRFIIPIFHSIILIVRFTLLINLDFIIHFTSSKPPPSPSPTPPPPPPVIVPLLIILLTILQFFFPPEFIFHFLIRENLGHHNHQQFGSFRLLRPLC